MSESIFTCPDCKSDRLKKNGHTAAGTQRYICKECDRSFTGTQHGGQNAKDDGLTAWQRHDEANREERNKPRGKRRKVQ